MKKLILILIVLAFGCKKETIEPVNTLKVDFNIEYLYANNWNCKVKITSYSQNYDSLRWYKNGTLFYKDSVEWSKKFIKSEGYVNLMLKGYQNGESKKITKIVDVFYFD